jgi:hypothetical protein
VLLVAVAQATWAGDLSGVITMAVLAVAALVVLAERGGVTPVRAASSWIRRGVIALASFVGLVAMFVVALPTLYLPGGLARLWTAVTSSALRWDDDRTNWVRQDGRRADELRDAGVPYTRAPVDVRRRRNAVGVIVVAVVVAGVAIGWRSRVGEREKARDQLLSGATVTTQPGSEIKKAIDAVQAVPFSTRPAYQGVDFADELQDELQRIVLAPNPAGDYRPEDFAGRYTSVRDGVRVTSAPRCDGCPTVRLWLVGGSAAFGLGQRDDHTIASDLVRLADRDGIALEVRNLGVPGWTLWQEHEALTADLAATDAPPDLVVFFDGYNDVAGTITSSVVHGVDPSRPIVLDPKDAVTFLTLLPEVGDDLDPTSLGRLAAERYGSQQRVIETELAARGIGSDFFFQPDALTSRVQQAPVERLYAGGPLAPTLKYLPTALETASTALAPQVHNLRHVFDDYPRVVFADTVHTNEAGAEVTASAMYDVLREAIRARTPK